MTILPFPEYAPDVTPFGEQESATIQNAYPRKDGYGPVQGVTQYSQALAAACRGYFYARNGDGSISVFAATSTRIYKLNTTTFAWAEVSQFPSPAAGYTALPIGDQWQFAQFNNFVIAVQLNYPPQVYDLTTSTLFADLGGSPPQARYIAIVNRFLVLSGMSSSTPYRIQWSGLNAPATWTSGVNSSDFQDLPDGGIVRSIGGGEFGLIMQDSCIRRMIYAPGTDYVFQIERVAQDTGIFAPLSLVRATDKLFFCGHDGFYVIAAPGTAASGYPTPIGKERVNRFFFADVDAGNLQLCIGMSDPKSTRVAWAYKSVNGTTGLFDKILTYDYALDRWSLVIQSGEYLSTLARPGITLESLDSIALRTVSAVANNGAGACRLTVSSTIGWNTLDTLTVSGATGLTAINGTWTIQVISSTQIDISAAYAAGYNANTASVTTSIDAMSISLDDFSTIATAQPSIVDSSHVLGFFTGANLEATLDSSEQELDGARRVRIQGGRPLTDAATCYLAVGARENLQTAPSYGTEQLIDARGTVSLNVSTRLARGRLRIPAGTTWTFASGFEPRFRQEGKR